MAIKAPIIFRGIALPAAYIKVSHIFGGTSGWNSVAEVFASTTAAGKNEDGTTNPELTLEAPLESFNVPVAYEADVNPFTLLYAELKNKYPDAVDCQVS